MEALARRDALWGPLLRLVFAFDDAGPLEDQTHNALTAALAVWPSFAAAVRAGEAGVWRRQHARLLEQAVLEMTNTEWFGMYPEYGCMVAVVGREQVVCGSEPQLALRMIALDRWQFAVHGGPHGAPRSFTAIDGTPPAVLDISPLPARLRDRLDAYVCAELAQAQAVSRDKRSTQADCEARGHQRTPAFVLAIFGDGVRKVIAAEEEEASTLGTMRESGASVADITQAKGGFTDVGLHTGGRPRPTSWPLAKATLWSFLQQNSCTLHDDPEAAAERFGSADLTDSPYGTGVEFVFGMALVQLELWLVERQLKSIRIEAHSVQIGEIDLISQMLQSAVARFTALMQNPSLRPCSDTLDDLVQRTENARQCLDAHLSAALKEVAKQYHLAAQDEREHDCNKVYRHPQLTLPKMSQALPSWQQGDIRSQALASLGVVPALINDQTLVANVANWIQSTQGKYGSNTAWKQITLILIERQLLSFARLLQKPMQNYHILENERLGEQLINLVSAYKLISGDFSTSVRGISSIEQRSRFTLMLWIAYCVMHKLTDRAYPGLHLATKFSVPLCFGDLRHLSLGGRCFMDALASVAIYLNSLPTDQPQLFSLRPSKHDGIYQLADAFAELNLEISSGSVGSSVVRVKDAAEREHNSQSKRRQQHWAKVCERKREAEKLERKMEELRRKYQKSVAKEEESGVLSQIEQLRHEIKKKLEPMCEFMPLPREKNDIARMLFFLRMPKLFYLLATLGFQAQHALTLKNVWDRRRSGKAYVEHYTSCGGSESALMLDEDSEIIFYLPRDPPDTYGPSTLEHYNNSDDGIYYPSNCPMMFWQMQDGKFINPFVHTNGSELASLWTPTLSDNQLQWAAVLYDKTDRSRGNKALATLESKPSWLSRAQYVQFGLLRAYPLMQLRRLYHVLRDDLLPLESQDVQVLLKHTLFHVGELQVAENGKVDFKWKRDFFDGEIRAQLCEALKFQMDNLSNAPDRYGALPVVIDLAIYVASYDHLQPNCTDLLRHFARGIVGLANTQQKELEKSVERGQNQESDIQQMKTKLARLLAYALCCFRFSALTREDVALMCELSVRFRYNQSSLSASSETMSLRCAVSDVMSLQRTTIISLVDDSALSKAAKSVLQLIPNRCFQWKPLLGGWSQIEHGLCWEAYYEGHFYHINLSNGELLFNGAPPGRLPSNIVNDALYKRTFGQRNFEVVKGGVSYRTLSSIGGAFYEFTAPEDSSTKCIRIVELPEMKTSDGKQLLASIESGLSELPVLLRARHSFWRDRVTGLILLRPFSFLERTVHFILQLQHSQTTENLASGQEQAYTRANSWICWRVPLHLQKKIVTDLSLEALRAFDQLMVQQQGASTCAADRTFSALSKFESPQFIHVLRSHQGTWAYELPRFHLRFELDRNGLLHSREFQGYVLASQQQLTDRLPNFTNYLVVHRMDVSTQQAETSVFIRSDTFDTRLLVPDGQVCKSETTGVVTISMDQDVNCVIGYLHYDWDDRFLQFKAPDIKSRLQLAAIHAATSTILPEPGLAMPGSAMAMALVRQCWVFHPLSCEELNKLVNVAQFTKRAPALHILCRKLEETSLQLRFLHVKEDPADPSKTVQPSGILRINPDDDACIEYKIAMFHKSINMHHQLTPEEAQLYLDDRPHACCTKVTPLLHCKEHMVAMIEDKLASFVVYSQMARKFSEVAKIAPCPIQASNHHTRLGQYHAKRCEISWDLHHRRLPQKIDDLSGLSSFIEESIQLVKRRQDKLESKLRELINRTSNPLHRIRRAANFASSATITDLVASIWLPHSVRLLRLNPHLSEEDCIKLRRTALLWLQLCVLIDRLGQVKNLLDIHLKTSATEPVEALLIREILTRREWSAEEHPQWLAFEAEGRLQVRSEQYQVAKCMMEEKDTIVQLNMGEGKTRLILPLLIMAHQKRLGLDKQTLRLVFLPQLLDDAYRFLHRHLCASAVLAIRLIRLPFHREVNPSLGNLRALHAVIERCWHLNGALVASPAHILSMQLKCNEWELQMEKIADKGKLVQKHLSLVGVLKTIKYRDIFDECDEILSHRYQLIYAAGNSMQLVQGACRWHCVQAILRCFLRALSNSPLHVPFLQLRELIEQEVELKKIDKPGAFLVQRLKTKPEDMNRVKHHMSRMVMKCLYLLGSRELDSLQLVPEEQREAFNEAIVNGDQELTQDMMMSYALALRGLLGHGVLADALALRSRVDFGIDESRLKRLAVPFRAYDTPSDRTEFAHVDRCLVLTHLAYYDLGLTEHQLREAIEKLKGLASVCIELYWSRWYQLSEPWMTREQREEFIDLRRVDLTNASQFKQLCQLFRFNAETINFWLDKIVLPQDTVQFDKQLKATPWMLVADKFSSMSSGFSGTNDNNLLLPIKMRPHDTMKDDSPLHSIGATKGQMLAYLLASSQGVHVISNNKEDGPMWKQTLKLALKLPVDALIDVGALLAGVNIEDAAFQLCQDIVDGGYSHKLKGVVYSCIKTGSQEWRIRGLQGEDWAHSCSPVQERDAFVIFDQHQCRGADMKLRQHAKALVTIGPRLCMDSLMQAAGRMRQLGRGQSLAYVLPQSIADEVRSVCKLADSDLTLEPQHLVRWAMENTVKASEQGLAAWADQGVHFVQSLQADRVIVQEEPLSLESLYQAPKSNQSVADRVKLWCHELRQKTDFRPERDDQLLSDIEYRAAKLGMDVKIASNRADEECERELERFMEVEIEEEKQLLRYAPAHDKPWDLKSALLASNPMAIVEEAGVMELISLLREVNPDWLEIGFEKVMAGRVFCTANFAAPIVESQVRCSKMDYMHLADVYLRWPSVDRVLLLSPCEAEEALHAFWSIGPSETGPVLGHLSFARRLADTYGCQSLASCWVPLNMPIGRRSCLSVAILAALQLFNGDTQFGTSEQGDQRQCIVEQELICSASAAKQARQMVDARMRGSHFVMSLLEKACKRHELSGHRRSIQHSEAEHK